MDVPGAPGPWGAGSGGTPSGPGPSPGPLDPPASMSWGSSSGAGSGFCPSCGAPVAVGSRFCVNCGATLPTVEPTAVPAAGPPQAGPPPASPTPGGATGSGWWLERWPLVAGAGIVVVLVAIAVFFVVQGASGSEEVMLESAASTGPDPFTKPVAPEQVSTTSTTGTSTTTTGPSGGTTTAPSTRQPAGPFGGTGDNTVCDQDLLISFLTNRANAAQARAWAQVRGIRVDAITTYILSLTPTVLTADIRVTNHSFKNGKAIPRQSVLQAGTAVLVDEHGEPVVRCRCGNPLLPPVRGKKPTYVGTPWPGFNPSTVVVVVVSPQVVFPTTSAPGATTPGTTTPGTTRPATTTTTAPGTTTQPVVGAEEAVAIIKAELDVCISRFGIDFVPLSYDPVPGSAPNVYVVTVSNEEGESAAWSVNVLTRETTPADQLAAETDQICENGLQF